VGFEVCGLFVIATLYGNMKAITEGFAGIDKVASSYSRYKG